LSPEKYINSDSELENANDIQSDKVYGTLRSSEFEEEESK